LPRQSLSSLGLLRVCPSVCLLLLLRILGLALLTRLALLVSHSFGLRYLLVLGIFFDLLYFALIGCSGDFGLVLFSIIFVIVVLLGLESAKPLSRPRSSASPLAKPRFSARRYMRSRKP